MRTIENWNLSAAPDRSVQSVLTCRISEPAARFTPCSGFSFPHPSVKPTREGTRETRSRPGDDGEPICERTAHVATSAGEPKRCTALTELLDRRQRCTGGSRLRIGPAAARTAQNPRHGRSRRRLERSRRSTCCRTRQRRSCIQSITRRSVSSQTHARGDRPVHDRMRAASDLADCRRCR